ncbi:MAG: OsmC family protein [Candidatus Lokiarchaeota archaeon]|nr:OsmC family protein [Candidatus Lokiarchaeota archaeon]
MRIELDWKEGVAFTAKARQFTLQLDEPESFHGADTGPSSAEYFGVSIGGCLGTSFAYCAKHVDIQLKAMKVTVDVELHHEGANDGGGRGPLRIVGIKASISVELQDDGDADVLDLCIESFKKYCVVTQSVMMGIPVDITVTRLG